MTYLNKSIILVSLLAIVFAGCTSNTANTVEALPASTPSPTPKREARPFDPQFDIGGIDYGRDCSWLRILNDSLMPGDSVRIVGLEHPQEITSATIIEPSGCTESMKSALGEFVIDTRPYREATKYQIKFDDKEKEEEFDFHLGIAIVNSENMLVVKDGNAELEMADAPPLRFRSCTSHEGLHFTVWKGKPLTGKRIWHAYQHFLYDTDPTCSEKETTDLYPEGDEQ